MVPVRRSLLALSVLCAPLHAAAVATDARLLTAQLPFLANQGQIDAPSVGYYARTFGGTLFVERSGRLVYVLPGGADRAWAFAERLVGAGPAQVDGRAPGTQRVSRFLGADGAAHPAAPPVYRAVELGEVYPGIAMRLKARGANVEKLFTVAPGADPAAIRLAVDGVDGLEVDAQGRLVVRTGLGPVRFTAPVAFQEVDGERHEVAVAYRVAGNSYGFALGEYDRDRPLVIDPLLASTFLGGSNDAYPLGPTQDRVAALRVAGDHVYVAGGTTSTDFPSRLGAFEGYRGGIEDGFVARFDAGLAELQAATFLGGEFQDRIEALTVAEDGSVYVTGYTNGNDFPVTAGAYAGGNGVGGPFVSRLSADLATLQASAILGVGSDTRARAVVHGDGVVYIAGQTGSPNLPTSDDAYDDSCGSNGFCDPSGTFPIARSDAFVAKFDAELTTLLASTYLGGSNVDTVAGLALDGSGEVLVAGETLSIGFPLTPGALIDDSHGINLPAGFVSRFDADLTALLASTLVGGSDGRSSAAAVAPGDGAVLVAGTTYASDLPVGATAYDEGCGSDGACDPYGSARVNRSDAFALKLDGALGAVLAGTYFGGNADDGATALFRDADGAVTVAGWTRSPDLPVPQNAYDGQLGGGEDAFVAAFDADLRFLGGATYLGGGDEDRALAVATDASGSVYVAGSTASVDFPATGAAYDSDFNGGYGDAFVASLDAALSGGDGPNLAPVAVAGGDRSVRPGAPVPLDGRASHDPDGSVVAYRWSQLAGPQVRLFRADRAVAGFRAPRVGLGEAELRFALEVTDDGGAGATDTVTVRVRR